MKIANALGISINVFMNFDIETISDVLSLILKMDEQLDMVFEAEKDDDGSFIPSTIKISFKNSLLNHKLGVYMKARELQENLINDTGKFPRKVLTPTQRDTVFFSQRSRIDISRQSLSCFLTNLRS